jgi:hypothetical protein
VSAALPGEGPVGRVRQWLGRVLLEPEYPLLALEVRPTAVAAVRLARDGGRLRLGAAGAVDLPPGTIDVSLTRANVLEPGAFSRAVRSALERVGASAEGSLSLVLPDAAVRLALIRADGLRRRNADADEVVRFRLHKALPFDVRLARLAWEPTSGEQVLVAVALDEVARQYEDLLEDIGLRVGLVEPASLALADAYDGTSGGDRILVNWDVGYVSFVLTRGREPVLVRTLPGEADPASVARYATGTLQFFHDRLGGGALDDALVRSAAYPLEEARDALALPLGLRPRPGEPWAALGGATEVLPVAQAVAGAAACALRRAA